MGILRFLLAISVVIAHSSSIFGLNFVGGQIAVQAFYIISGFYMTLVLNEKYIGENNSYKLFISNRALRLYPIYWVILIFTIAYSVFTYLNSGGMHAAKLYSYKVYHDTLNIGSLLFLIFTNVFLFFQDFVLFLGLNTESGNLFFTQNYKESNPIVSEFLFIPQAWTIGIEMLFYVIAPFLVKRKIKLIFVFIAITIILRCILYFGLNLKHDPWTYRFFPTELVFFLLGTISYHIYKKYQNRTVNKFYLNIIWFSIIAITTFFSLFNFPTKEYLYLFIFFISLPFVFILTKNFKKDAYIGELSYPIYISHIFMTMILNAFGFPITGVFLVLGTTVMSILLNEFVAKKIEKIRQRRMLKNTNI